MTRVMGARASKGGGGGKRFSDNLGAALPQGVEGGTWHHVQHTGLAAGGGGGAGGTHQEVILSHDGSRGVLKQSAPPPRSLALQINDGDNNESIINTKK